MGSGSDHMDGDRSGGLILVDVRWEEKTANAWLLREVFDLLLRDPDLTGKDTPLTMEPEGTLVTEGGET